MKQAIRDFFQQEYASYEEGAAIAPRGLSELMELSRDVRLEFIRDYWLNALPYTPEGREGLLHFFRNLDELHLITAQKGEGSPDVPLLIYSMKGEKEFFLGGMPLKDKEIDEWNRQGEMLFPEDYRNFFRIHDGFARAGDTGVVGSAQVGQLKEEMVSNIQGELRLENRLIDPATLFPFYRSYDRPLYQCFYREWFVDGEVGNVLCSLEEGTISNYPKGEGALAFRSYIDWLLLYLMEDTK